LCYNWGYFGNKFGIEIEHKVGIQFKSKMNGWTLEFASVVELLM